MQTSEEIRAKFESGAYTFAKVPWIFEADCEDGISVRKDGYVQDPFLTYLNVNEDETREMSQKLKCKGCGEFTISIDQISAEYFQSRLRFEDIFARRWWQPRPGEPEPPEPKEIVPRLSLREILEKFGFEVTCNLDFYLKNRLEIEKDLEGDVVEYNINEEESLKKLETNLLAKNMKRIFGVEEVPDKMDFTDFRMCYDDGNDAYASMARGENYYTIYYGTS